MAKPMIANPGPFPEKASKKEQDVFWSKFRRHKDSYQYEQNCKYCGKVYKVQTQEDKDPEYYTDVYVICDCGNDVHFSLPVN